MHLIQALKDHNIVRYGDFTLKSGKKSNIYFNFKGLYEYPQLMTNVCYQLSKLIKTDNAIAGVPMGGIPFATLVSYIKQLPLMLIRQEKKEYGLQQQIEGNHNNLIIIEDCLTTGASVLETINILKEHNINVVQIISIINREEGGVDRLQSMGYQVNCLFKQSDFINPCFAQQTLISNKIKDKLVQIRDEKGTNLIASLDCDNLYEVMEIVGPYVCAIKLHGDIYDTINIDKINELKEKFNFMIIEDRKFSDIPYICLKQLKLIKRYADIVTVHGICGGMLIKEIGKEVGVLVVHNMSLKDNLIDILYQTKVEEIECDNLVGYVSQHKIEGYLTFTPGIHLDTTGDGLNQQYREPINSDFYIVGRGIYEGDVLDNVIKYKNACYNKI